MLTPQIIFMNLSQMTSSETLGFFIVFLSFQTNVLRNFFPASASTVKNLGIHFFPVWMRVVWQLQRTQAKLHCLEQELRQSQRRATDAEAMVQWLLVAVTLMYQKDVFLKYWYGINELK